MDGLTLGQISNDRMYVLNTVLIFNGFTGQGGIDIGNKSADQEEILAEHVNKNQQENIVNTFNIRKSHTTSRENINFSDQDQVLSRSTLSLEKQQLVYKEGQEGRKKIEMR